VAVSRTSHQGFTLIELMVTIAIAAILLTIGVPSLTSFFDRQKVVAAAEEAYSFMQLAKIEALSRSVDIYVNVEDGINSWSYGMSTSEDCDSEQTVATASDACILPFGDEDIASEVTFQLVRKDNSTHEGIRLTSYLDGATYEGTTKFDYTRGMHEKDDSDVPTQREFRFNYKDMNLSVIISKLGRIKICSSDGSVGNYEAC